VWKERKYKDETSHYSKAVKSHESWLNERSFTTRTMSYIFGFLRAGEIVVPSSAGYDMSVHLSMGDVTLDSRVSHQ
jgi:hypothetical protein